MCMFERPHIIGSIPTHERDVSEFLEGRYDQLLLFGSDAGVHTDARQQAVEEATVLLHQVGDTLETTTCKVTINSEKLLFCSFPSC